MIAQLMHHEYQIALIVGQDLVEPVQQDFDEKNRLTISASVSTRSVGRHRHQAGNFAGSRVI